MIKLLNIFTLSSLLTISCSLYAESISLTAPEDGAILDLQTPCVKEFYANFEKRGVKPPRPEFTTDEIKYREECIAQGKEWYDRFDFYIFNDWSRDLQKRCAEETKTWKPIAWEADYSLVEFQVEFSKTPDFNSPIIEKAENSYDRCMRPNFLKIGTKYFWRVKAKKQNGEIVVSNVRSFITAENTPRMIGIPSNNMRDIGGGKNADGIRVRQGLIYRGTAPQVRWSQEQLKNFYVDNLGIKLEIDLRGQDECFEAREKWGEGNLEELGIKHVFITAEDYHLYHPRSLECIPKICALLADENNYPVYIHCAVGSDRTGTLFAVLNGIIGRDDRYIYDDYESPSFSEWLPRFRYGRKSSELFGYLDPSAPRWEECHGKLDGKNIRENAERYLLAIGVPQEHIDAIRRIMLEEAGEQDTLPQERVETQTNSPEPLSLLHDTKVVWDPNLPVSWVEENGERILKLEGATEHGKEGRIDWHHLDLERFRGREVFFILEYKAEGVLPRSNKWSPSEAEEFHPMTWHWEQAFATYSSWHSPGFVLPKEEYSTDWTTLKYRGHIAIDDDLSNNGARLVATFGKGTMLVRDFRIEVANDLFMDEVVKKAGATIPDDYKCEYSQRGLDEFSDNRWRGIVFGWRDNYTEEDFDKIKSWGCNVIRLIGFRPHEDDYAILDKYLAMCRERGIKVVFQPAVPGATGNRNKYKVFNDAELRKAYLMGCAKIAKRFKDSDDIWALGLMNEPFQNLWVATSDMYSFWQLQYEAIKVIRKFDPNRPIIATADGPGAPGSYRLPYMRPFPFKDIWYELHFYTPLAYTHHDVYWKDIDFSKPGQTYPGLRIFGDLQWDKAALQGVMDQAQEFSNKWGARWYLGEFSTARHVPGAAQWLDDVASIADTFPNLDFWTYHSYGEYHAWNLEYDEASPFKQGKLVPACRN